jgi:hypothetical protein
MRKKKQRPPYSGSIILDMPDRSQKTVRLPSVTGYEVGERESVSFMWKERHQVMVKLIRVAGGWDVEEG